MTYYLNDPLLEMIIKNVYYCVSCRCQIVLLISFPLNLQALIWNMAKKESYQKHLVLYAFVFADVKNGYKSVLRSYSLFEAS